MADESLRDLERAVRLAPTDSSARMRYVHELVRAGRRREALAWLELSKVSAASFANAKRLADELWLEQLKTLAPRTTVAHADVSHLRLDLTGGLVAWAEELSGFVVVDALSGVRVFADAELVARGLAPLRGGFLAHDVPRRRLTRVLVRGGNVDVAHMPLDPERFTLSQASPDGDRVLYDSPDRWALCAWPASLPLIQRNQRFELKFVDWESGLVFAVEQSPELYAGRLATWAIPFHDHGVVFPPPAFEVPFLLDVKLAPRVYASQHQEVRLVQLAREGTTERVGWDLRLLAHNYAWYSEASLASDGRGVRIALGELPVRFDVDLASGKLVAGTVPVEPGLHRLPVLENGFWHPHADVTVVFDHRGRSELVQLGGDVLHRFDSSTRPRKWTADGTGLLVVRELAPGRSSLEIWRAPTG